MGNQVGAVVSLDPGSNPTKGLACRLGFQSLPGCMCFHPKSKTENFFLLSIYPVTGASYAVGALLSVHHLDLPANIKCSH